MHIHTHAHAHINTTGKGKAMGGLSLHFYTLLDKENAKYVVFLVHELFFIYAWCCSIRLCVIAKRIV